MTPSLTHLAHVALVTPDLERSLWFYRDLLGMEEVAHDGDSVYLRCYQELGHHSLILRDGGYTGADHYAFRTRAREDIAAFASQLRADGVEVTDVAAGEELGQGEAIRFAWPHAGHTIELFFDIERPLAPEEMRSALPSNSSKRRGLGARRMDHINVACATPEVEPAELWLQDRLGFVRHEYFQPEGGPVLSSWLAVTPQVHDVGIMPDFARNRPGRLHHLAFNLENHSDVLVAADIFTEHGINIHQAPGKHGISQGMYLYVEEPGSGHRVELFAGGYLVFDGDWEPIRWTEENFAHPGLGWWGPDLDVSPDAKMFPTTPSYESDDDARSVPTVAAGPA